MVLAAIRRAHAVIRVKARPGSAGNPVRSNQTREMPGSPGLLQSGRKNPQARPAKEAGEMVLNAIRKNRAVITTDASHLQVFEMAMAAMVREAFADAAEYDRLKGR